MWINSTIDAPIGDGNLTFSEIKRWIEQTYQIPERFQHLHFAPDGLNFVLLDDDATVIAYGLDNNDRLFMALAPVVAGESASTSNSVNFYGHASDVIRAQHLPEEPQPFAGINNSNDVNNVDDGRFNVHEYLVDDDNAYDHNFDGGAPLLQAGDHNQNPGMLNNYPPQMNQQNLNLNEALNMDDNIHNDINHSLRAGMFGFVPNPPLLVAGALNLSASVGNDPLIMNQQNPGLNDSANYGPLTEILEFIPDPSIPIDQLGGRQQEQDPIANQQNPNTDELHGWHLSMNPTIGAWDKSDALPQADVEHYSQPSGDLFFGMDLGLFAQQQQPLRQNLGVEGSIGHVGEAGPSHTEIIREGSAN